MAREFKKVYCERYACGEEEFHLHLLRRSFFLPGQLLYFISRLFVPQAFMGESSLIDQIGRANTVNEVRDELDFYHHKYVSNSTLRGAFYFRVSGQKLIRLAKDLNLPTSV